MRLKSNKRMDHSGADTLSQIGDFCGKSIKFGTTGKLGKNNLTTAKVEEAKLAAQ